MEIIRTPLMLTLYADVEKHKEKYQDIEGIELEETPDTVITLTSGKQMVVEETVDQVVSLVVDYKRKIHSMNV